MAKAKQPTAQDAQLILQLYDLRREAVMRKARNFVGSEFWPQSFADINAAVMDSSTDRAAWLRQVTSYWDMAAAMVLAGAINEDLFFQTNGEPYFIYAKFKPYLAQLRKEYSPEYMANLEKLANRTAQSKDRVKRLGQYIKMRTEQATKGK